MSRVDDALHEVRPRHPRAWIGGSCAELSDRFGLPIWVVRLGVLFAFYLAQWATAIAYVVVTMALRTKFADMLPARSMGAPSRRRRDAPSDPGYGLQRDRFSALEARLARLEAAVTSDELRLRARFRDIEG